MHRHWSSHSIGRIGGVDLASWTGYKPTGSLSYPIPIYRWIVNSECYRMVQMAKYFVTVILLWKASISEDETSVTLTSENILPRAQLRQACTFGMSDHAIEAEMQQSCAHSLSTCSKLLACLSSNTKLVFWNEYSSENKVIVNWYVALLMRFGHAQPLNFRY